MRLFVGNLPFSTTEQDLVTAFGAVGACVSARIVTDRDSNQSRGFGFVDMASAETANVAIEQLHGSELGGRRIVVAIAHERPVPSTGRAAR